MAESVYYRITITGDPGSGKTTFARNVTERTGFRLITTGNMFRELAAKKGISVRELNELAEKQEEIDREVDDYLVSLNDAPEHLILDSRMAWHFVKGALKIRLSVDMAEAARRIFEDNAELREKFSSIEEGIEELKRRKASEIHRYKSLYGVDIGDNANFDLIIDTSHKTQEEVLAEFDQAFEAYKTRMDHAAA